MKTKRIAEGHYESADGRFMIYRERDIYPPAWSVEDVSDPETPKMVVDGAATKRDAIAFADEAIAAC